MVEGSSIRASRTGNSVPASSTLGVYSMHYRPVGPQETTDTVREYLPVRIERASQASNVGFRLDSGVPTGVPQG